MNNYLANYLEELRNKGSVEMAESIEETSTKFSKEHLASLSFSSWETGLLFGNVQAGKTAQVFGLACSAANYGFPLFLLLTTDNVTLQ